MVVSLVLELPPPESIPKDDVLAIAPTSITSSTAINFSTISSVTSAVSVSGVSLGIVNVILICVLSISGINAIPLENDATALNTKRTKTSIITNGLTFNESSNAFPYIFINPPNNLPSFCSFVLVRSPALTAGTTVSAIRRLASSE